MSKINKYTSVSEIISGIYRYRGNSNTVINTSDIYDWIKLFLAKINYPFQYKKKYLSSTSFSNYSFKLPKDFYELEFICVNGVIPKLDHYSSLVNVACCSGSVPEFFSNAITSVETSKLTSISYSINDNFIRPTVKEGTIEIQYKAIALDEDGIPLIPDTELYKNAIIWFLVERLDYMDWRSGIITDKVYAKTEQEYAWAVGQLTNTLKVPNEEEMIRMQRIFTRFVIPDTYAAAAADCSIELCSTCNSPASSCNCVESSNARIFDGSEDEIITLTNNTPMPVNTLKGFRIFDKWVSPTDDYTNVYGSDYITGMSFARHWKNLNPALGVYDFTDLINDIQNGLNEGKTRFGLKIAAGKNCPDWIYSNGVTKLIFAELRRNTIPVTHESPIFWETAYKTFWKNFITALEAAINPFIPALDYVALTGINRDTAECFIPYQKYGPIDSPSIWISNGYTTQNHMDTFTELVTHVRTVFPTIKLLIPLVSTFKINTDNINNLMMDYLAANYKDDTYISDTYVIENYNGTKMTDYAKSKGLKISGELAEVFYGAGTASKNSIDSAVKRFKSYGGSFLEIYTNNVKLQSQYFRPLSTLFK